MPRVLTFREVLVWFTIYRVCATFRVNLPQHIDTLCDRINRSSVMFVLRIADYDVGKTMRDTPRPRFLRCVVYHSLKIRSPSLSTVGCPRCGKRY